MISKNKHSMLALEIRGQTGLYVLYALCTSALTIVYFSWFQYRGNAFGYKCAADYIDGMVSADISRLLFVPFLVIFTYMVTGYHSTYGYVLRCENRLQWAKKRWSRIFWHTLAETGYLMMSAILLALLFEKTRINWKETSSLFYYMKGYLSDLQFGEVVFLNWLKLFAVVLFLTFLAEMVGMVTGLTGGIIAVLLCQALNLPRGLMLVFFLKMDFMAEPDSYFDANAWGLYAGVFPAAILICLLIMRRLVKQKDFLK